MDPSIRFTTDLNGILQDHEVGLVVICTHLDSHVEYATGALENNKHILVEKPFAPTIEKANQVFELAKSKGLIAMAIQNRRFDGDFLTL